MSAPITPVVPASWQAFSAAPHRMLFFGGVLQTVLAMGLWLIALGSRASGALDMPWTLPATWVHAFLMVYGVFPFFIFGFLLTVYPRWLGGPAISPSRYVPISLALISGMLLFYLGLFSARGVLLAGIVVYLSGWLLAIHTLLDVYRQAQNRGPHERLLNLALAAGACSLGAFLAALLGTSVFWFQLAREAGVWLFLVPVVFLVSHRMIPFFSHSVLMHYLMVRPSWGPSLMLCCVGAHAVFELSGLPQWRFLADLPLAIAALHHSWVWQFRRSFHARLLAMLHIAFLWLGIAMTLYALQSAIMLATGVDVLGRAPLHALGIGFFTGMIVAMASRVTLGHSGRTLHADRLTWLTLIGVNISALLRIAGELIPTTGMWLNLLAAVVWFIALAAWAGHYVPMYLRPRVDRQPGY